MNENKVALATALILSGLHLVWAILILFGVAQMLTDFIFWMHMLKPVWIITGFSITQTLILLATTFVMGYVIGWAFAWVWNKLHKK